jgi:AcrR family transcriptional regulator
MSKKKSKAYHHGDLHETVVRLALEMLETSTPDEVTLRELSRRAGVSSMAIYRHFVDRDALISELAVIGFKDLGERMRVVDETGDAKAALNAIGVVYVGFAVERPGLFRLMYGGKVPETPIQPGQAPHAAFENLARRIAELVKPRDRDAAFLASWALVHGLATLLISDRIREPVKDPEATAKKVVGFFMNAFE